MPISDHDLERYDLGMVQEPELAALEEPILGCAACAERAKEPSCPTSRSSLILCVIECFGLDGGSEAEPRSNLLRLSTSGRRHTREAKSGRDAIQLDIRSFMPRPFRLRRAWR